MQVLLSIALAVVVTGCSGVTTNVSATTSRYPISLSRAVPMSDGRVVYAGDGLRKVGELDETYWRWSVPYDAIDGDIDVSEDVNRAVAEARGEAVVNLAVSSSECLLDWFVILNWLPFWPSCAVVSVAGDIVVREPTAMDSGGASP